MNKNIKANEVFVLKGISSLMKKAASQKYGCCKQPYYEVYAMAFDVVQVWTPQLRTPVTLSYLLLKAKQRSAMKVKIMN